LTVRVWNRETGVEAARLAGDRAGMSWVYNLARGPGDQTVLVSAYNGVWVWDWHSGEARRLRELEHSGKGLVATPDGRQVIVCSWTSIESLDFRSGSVVTTFHGHASYVSAVALSADGRWLVSGSGDHTVKVWDRGCTTETNAVAPGGMLLSADGRWALIEYGGKAQVWDVERAALLRELGCRHWGRAVAVTPAGDWWLVSSETHVVTLRPLEGKTVRKLGGEIRCDVAAASWDGRRLVVGSDDWGDDPLVAWDIESRKRLLDPDTGPAFAVAMSGDGRWVAGGFNGSEPRIRVWDLETGQEAYSWQGYTTALAMTFDGRWVVAGIGDQVRVFDAQSGEAGPLAGHSQGVNAVAITGDGRWVVSGSADRTIRVWDREASALVATFHAEAAVHRCGVTPEGRTVVAADASSRVYFLRLERAG
jgi:WD40 repeat protein